MTPIDLSLVKLIWSGGLGTLIGGAAGALGKAFWVRWIEDRTLPTAEILNRVASGKLTSYGRRRLENEGREMLSGWQTAHPAPREGAKLPTWPDANFSVHSRPTSYGEIGNPCPQSTSQGEPLYFSLENDNPDDLAAELETEFEKLDKQFAYSRALINQLKYPSGRVPMVWISCLNVQVRKHRDLREVSERMWKEVRKTMPSASVTVELYVPAVFSSGNIASSSCLTLPSRPSARYVFLRDQVAKRLAEGVALGDLPVADREVPKDLIENRHPVSFRKALDDPEAWNAIAISGPPGSGKSDLGHHLVCKLRESARAISVTVSTPGVLEAIRTLPDQVTMDGSFQMLTDAIVQDAQTMVPQALRETEDWKQPFADALFGFLQARTQNVLIVIDDLHVHPDVAAAANRLRANGAPYRFLLISRSAIRNASASKLLCYECKLWSRIDAEKMLRFWVSDTNQTKIDNALHSGWPQRQESFSLYLLRAMAEYIDSLENAPSELLNKVIRGHISPLAQMLRSEVEPPAIVLERIKQLVAKPDASCGDIARALGERNEVEPIFVMGILAWYTSFAPAEPGSERQHRAFLDADRVLQFSKGIVSSKDLAEQILEAGTKAKIFDKSSGAFRNVYGWRDKLVADGCAALYLAFEIDNGRMDDSSIANCIESLDEKRSLDILALAVDTTLLVKIICAITAARPNLASILDRLLTAEVADRMSGIVGTLDEVSDKLFDLAKVTDLAQLCHVARALAKVMRFSETVKQQCWQEIRSSSPDRAMTALAAIAIDHDGSKSYFEILEANDLAEFLYPIALEAAAWVWTNDAWQLLSARAAILMQGTVSRERVERFWGVWCRGRTTEEILRAVVGLIDTAYTTQQEVFLTFAAVALENVVKTRKPAERNSMMQLFSHIGAKLRNVTRAGYHRRSADVVRWLARQYGENIVGSDLEWVMSQDGRFAFSRLRLKTESIPELFSGLRPVREHFTIASSQELRDLDVEDGMELIRDGYGERFSYDAGDLMLGQVQAWNGKDIAVIQKSLLNVGPFYWRPRFSLPG